MTDSGGGRIRTHEPTLVLLHRCLDALVVGASLFVLCSLYGMPWGPQYGMATAAAVTLFSVVSGSRDLYRSWRGGGILREGREILFIWATVLAGLLAFGFVTQSSADFSRRVILSWFVVAPLGLVVYRVCVRALLRELRRHGRNTRAVAIAGAGALGRRVANVLEGEPWMGLRLLGIYDDDATTAGTEAPVRGGLDDLVEAAQRREIDVIYLALPSQAEHRTRELIRRLADTAVAVYLVPDLLSFQLLRSRWVPCGPIPTVSVYERPLHGVERLAKRLQDLVLASAALAVFALPMLAIAVGVKLSSPGPVLFRQRRYGLDGREIRVWKFRSMRVCEDGPEVRQASRGDERVTRFGAFLRMTSLDELPQVFNVLRGSMSIVGPRPHPVVLNEEHRGRIEGYMLRHRIKPGITGWAQVNGYRGETDTPAKMEGRVEHDLYYIENWSTWLDLKVLFLTVVRGFVNRNAY